MSTERTIAWVSWGDQRGYTRLHKIEVADKDGDRSIVALWREGKLRQAKCGVKLPVSVVDLAEDTATLRCNRCFK